MVILQFLLDTQGVQAKDCWIIGPVLADGEVVSVSVSVFVLGPIFWQEILNLWH